MAKRPRERLAGMELADGWRVTSVIPKTGSASGGLYSSGYKVNNKEGGQAFLKAIDFYEANFAPDPARALQPLLETFNFERDLLIKCRDKSPDRVVRYITEGKVMIEGHAVQYLIFELADRDIRGQIDLIGQVDLAWQLRALHHIATGVKQLHGLGIAHQDLKPSNVLVFAGNIFKIGDLGHSAHSDYSPPHEGDIAPGDPSYRPPELLYSYALPDWKRRRFGTDLYLLGSLTVFVFTKANMTSLLQQELEHFHHWKVWKGSYQQVLPFVRDAYGKVLQRIKKQLPIQVRDDIMRIIRQLCDPEPERRGHPRNRNVPYELERYVNELNILARKAEMKLF